MNLDRYTAEQIAAHEKELLARIPSDATVGNVMLRSELGWSKSHYWDIRNYLIENRPQLANSTVRKLYDSVRSLRSSPYRGRRGAIGDSRELLLVPLPYIVVYRIRHDAVEVLHIYHTAQKRP